ncbi:hypothetical protein [Pandoraea sp. SD6-2]|uniref:hypothetical protein n=1 Tax=Pandoraea sp. SD6-2 TaxID=1286093 RepID=UPI0003308929|nr:hypothetical protein [Pandoraea sp. SD6-2]EON13430.1 hypothetical protein C266_11255 [Pandoraea sp. SD6-2]
MRLVALAALLALLSACTDSDTARRALVGAGYTDVHIDGYSFYGCGDNDDYSTAFTARGPTGVLVSGAVCSSFLTKAATIRFN